MLHDLIVIWFGWVRDGGYLGVAGLMALESTIVPVPSEIVIPPAAYWAAEGKLNIWGVIAAGTIGSYIGSAASYWVALRLGRAAVARWGRYALLSEAKLERAERMMHRYEAGGIFFARLLPVVRHLISLPAGLVRMNFKVFSLMTILGSFVWCSVLAWFGQKVGRDHPGAIEDPEKFMHAVKADAHWVVLAVLGMAVLYVLMLRLTAPKAAPEAAAPPPAA